MINDLISLFFPQNCLNCRCSLLTYEHFLCTACKLDLPITSDHEELGNDLLKKFSYEPKIVWASAYLYFIRGGMVQKLLHELKYNGKKDLGVQLGAWYGETITNLDIDLVVPVPLHRSKQRKRGYNQSEFIAKGIAKIIDRPVVEPVYRRIATITQTGKSKVDRWINLENVYSEADSCVENKSVLVVDDVITTGATIGMLCQRLVDASVKAIYIASVARGQ